MNLDDTLFKQFYPNKTKDDFRGAINNDDDVVVIYVGMSVQVEPSARPRDHIRDWAAGKKSTKDLYQMFTQVLPVHTSYHFFHVQKMFEFKIIARKPILFLEEAERVKIRELREHAGQPLLNQ